MNLKNAFDQYISIQISRILTNFDRDIDSPTYGSFDRNYWHYKIRDFSSSILQQSAFSLIHLPKITHLNVSPDSANRLAAASIKFFIDNASYRGGVNEYYPYENSYPALAFSLHSFSKIFLSNPHNELSIHNFDKNKLKKIFLNLLDKEEVNAANQYATGISALAMASKLNILNIDQKKVNQHFENLLSLQDDEGWFNEYGGPDLGYLSVTIDALWDYYEVTSDARAFESAMKAMNFIVKLVQKKNKLPWTFNSRNTDYIVPYGIVRLAKYSEKASWLAHFLFEDIAKKGHFVWSTDDRYHLHYIFNSIVRASEHINSMKIPRFSYSRNGRGNHFKNSGYILKIHNKFDININVSVYKGGLLRINSQKHILLDNGWRIKCKGKLYTTNWWNVKHKYNVSKNQIIISGDATYVSLIKSSPLKHFILRILSFSIGSSLIPILKKFFIFRSSGGLKIKFNRIVSIDNIKNTVIVEDQIRHPIKTYIWESPRQNLRYVASADSFSNEEIDSAFTGGVKFYSKNRTVTKIKKIIYLKNLKYEIFKI